MVSDFEVTQDLSLALAIDINKNYYQLNIKTNFQIN